MLVHYVITNIPKGTFWDTESRRFHQTCLGELPFVWNFICFGADCFLMFFTKALNMVSNDTFLVRGLTLSSGFLSENLSQNVSIGSI